MGNVVQINIFSIVIVDEQFRLNDPFVQIHFLVLLHALQI